MTAAGTWKFNIAVFASGSGTNARRIIEHFQASAVARVTKVVCNRPDAGVLQIAGAAAIPMLLIEKERFFRGDGYLPELAGIDLVVLAGFLWKIPQSLIDAFPRRIVNIHPALLPKHGGKGMYGDFVHESVMAAGDQESGITIHYVDEHYDNGDIIFQARCSISESDTPQTIRQKVQELEHRWYPEVIGQVLEEVKSQKSKP
jgi:phosphoribosylglycinamide formyltransferase 1